MEIEKILKEQRNFFETGATKSIQFRQNALNRLEIIIKKHEREIADALKKDLHKSAFESYMTETGLLLNEIRYVKKHLAGWMKEKRVPTPLAQFPAKSRVIAEPYGVVLIIAPWNYPFLLCLQPLIDAISGGNCCVIKPSGASTVSFKMIKKIIEEAFPLEFVAVIKDGEEENKKLLEQKFDFIFYTGGPRVGKLIMEQAAKQLTPVVLELGGKSPCIVEESADLNLAAKRIVFGKFLNSGQTCVAPDYVLVQESVKEELILKMCKWIHRMYGKEPLKCKDYPKIISSYHYERLMKLLKEELVVSGGYGRKETLQIAPTILNETDFDAPVMQEEIFGPILPVIGFETIERAVNLVKQKEKPLALYLFTKEQSVKKQVLSQLSFGGGCVNDTIVHLATSYMGFGGVGASGMGSYHGKAGFDTFSHKKSLLVRKSKIDIPIRYLPYRKYKNLFLHLFLR